MIFYTADIAVQKHGAGMAVYRVFVLMQDGKGDLGVRDACYKRG